MFSPVTNSVGKRLLNQSVQRILFCILTLLLIIAPIGPVSSVTAANSVYKYANGISLAPGSPLPVYHLSTIPVNADVTTVLSRNFDGIFDPSNFQLQEDMYIQHSRFTGLNEAQHSILEQFSATGGFYAYEPERAFSNMNDVQNQMLDARQGQELTCQFLLNHLAALGPRTEDLILPGMDVSCDNNFGTNPLYSVSTETLTGQSAEPGTEPTNTPIRLAVTVPILVNTGLYIQTPTIPLGGPGGHISMIFDTTNPDSPMESIDSHITGLQAVAMPAFGRDLEFDRLVPSIDPAAAIAQIMQNISDTFPGGTNVFIPEPNLVYFMTDAAMPQKLLEPALVFPGVSVDVGGQTLVLKDIVMPALESGSGGLGPTVTITSPANGSTYFPLRPESLEGSISDGQAPYTYTWQLDDGTSLGGGVLASAGNLPAVSVDLPKVASKTMGGSLTIHLVVTDAEGATREQVVTLSAPVSVYLPITMQKATGTQSRTPSHSQPSAFSPEAIHYSYGVEYGSDYPPYGPGGSDLAGVPPDANGFSSGLSSLGYPRIFNWYNSLAWERDWRDCSLGGSDCTYGVDRADFVYYSGHGNNGGIAVPSNTHDSGWFDGINARYQNARWVGFSSCLTLRAQWPTPGSEPIRRWFGAFQGAHMLLGFNSLMADIAFGPRLVDNMRIPTFLFIEFPWAQRTIAEAWVQTAFEMNAGKPAYLWATSVSVNPVGNKLPKVGDPYLPRPYPVNWYYWVWWND